MWGRTFCDHIALYFEYPVCTVTAPNNVNTYHKTKEILVVNWNMTFDKSLRLYCEGLDFLSEDFFSRVMSYKGMNSSKFVQTRDLYEAYDFVIRRVRDVSIKISDLSVAFKNLQVIGLKKLCKYVYQRDQQAFVDKNINGKVRTGENFQETKKIYSFQAFIETSKQKFWMRAKQMVPKKTNIQTCLVFFVIKNDIAELFSEN